MTHAIIDTRNLEYNRLQSSGGFARISANLPALEKTQGHTLQVTEEHASTYTGHMIELRSKNAATSFGGVPASDGEFIHAAKSYMQSMGSAVGFNAGAPIEFEGDSTVTRTSTDMRIVSLQQTINGIEVWGMEPKIWFHPDGSVDRMTGNTVSIAASQSAIPIVAPEIALQVAAKAAAAVHGKTDMLGINSELPELDLSQWTPHCTGQDSRAARITAFDNGPFEEIGTASLVYFYMGDQTRLAWRFIIAREFHVAQFLILVDADGPHSQNSATPEILYMRDMSSAAIGGQVYKHNPDESDYQRVDFPLPASAYPLPVPPDTPKDFPTPWTVVKNGRLSTEGNNTRGLNGTTRQPYSIAVKGDSGDFKPVKNTPEQYVTNIFFFCNYMHDFFLLLGFDEASGNFQVVDAPGVGKGNDPVYAYAHPGAVYGTANMATRADGKYGVMNMGLVTDTGRHTANDADVVFHEFVHGVSNRLVGGKRDAQGLNEEQSVSMGEGWGDFFALTIRNFSYPVERVVTGNYIVNNSAGIRQLPYDERYPGTFGDLGKGRGQVTGYPNLSYDEEHNVGEIWCATLMHMMRTVTKATGGDKARAYQLCWQAVVDGLKLTPKDPTFLTARNAIMKAWDAMQGKRITRAEYPAIQRAAWEAFAKFGMGVDAYCPNASLKGCVGSNAMPPDGWED